MRATVTTDTAALIANDATVPGGGTVGDADARSYIIFSATIPPSGTVLLKPGPAAGPAPDMSDAARYPFSDFTLDYVLEPGQALYAKTSAGTVELDILEGGER